MFGSTATYLVVSFHFPFILSLYCTRIWPISVTGHPVLPHDLKDHIIRRSLNYSRFITSCFPPAHHLPESIELGQTKKNMIRAWLIPTLYLSSAVMVSISANITPDRPDVSKGMKRAQIPGLFEKRDDSILLHGVIPCSQDDPCPIGAGICWYVVFTPLLSFPQPAWISVDRFPTPLCRCSLIGFCCINYCWYVVLTLIISIFYHFPISPIP
jgi:hypothetical protein